jgi:hypothetical protein
MRRCGPRTYRHAIDAWPDYKFAGSRRRLSKEERAAIVNADKLGNATAFEHPIFGNAAAAKCSYRWAFIRGHGLKPAAFQEDTVLRR